MSKAKASKAYIILRIVTIVFAILCPTAMISSAVAITLYEGDWWFNLFAFYLGAILMIVGTLYLSLLALLGEITRYFANKTSVPPVIKWIHRLLTVFSVAGIISFILFFLILCDLLNGGFAILHFICAVAILLLYLVNGILTIKNRNS